MLGHEDEFVAARYYSTGDEQIVHCELCAHHCRIKPGKFGICQVRFNVAGQLKTLVYGHTISQGVDPIEKKPLYHFLPGTQSYSIATPGCNFRCDWCQNWQISQMPRQQKVFRGRSATPEQIVESALSTGCQTIAYTYTEPTIFAEYAYDVGVLAHDAGIRNVFVTGGYMTETMLQSFDGVIDAANVDLKAFQDSTYRRHIGASLQPVLDSIKWMHAMGIWLEITTLVIPGLNDDPAELADIAGFIAQEVDLQTPWHISRFHPGYKFGDVAPTPLDTMKSAYEIGRQAGLQHVYLGNVPELSAQHTVCADCGAVLIERHGYRVLPTKLEKGRCSACGADLAGVYSIA